MSIKKFSRLVMSAFDHHGGQNFPLYSFASCGGVVHNEEHRTNLLREIEKCQDWYEQPRKGYWEDDKKKLQKLKDYITKAKIGFCYETKRMYDPVKYARS